MISRPYDCPCDAIVFADGDIAHLQADSQRMLEEEKKCGLVEEHETGAVPPRPPMIRRQSSLVGQAGAKILCDASHQLRSLLARLRAEQKAQLVNIKAVARVVSALSNQTQTSSKHSDEERIVFQLRKTFRQELTPWFGLVAATLLSSQGHADMLQFNPFLAPEDFSTTQSAVAACLFRVINLGHVRRCASETEQLVMSIRNVLERQLLSMWRQRAGANSFVPTDAMVAFALESSNFDISGALSILTSLFESLQRLAQAHQSSAAKCAKTVTLVTSRMAAVLALHVASFECGRAEEIIVDGAKCSRMLQLSRRGCFMEGQQLLSLPVCVQCWSAGPAEEAGAESFTAMVHLLQHTAQSLARNLVAERAYTRGVTGAGEDCYDPRFLVFEVGISSIYLFNPTVTALLYIFHSPPQLPRNLPSSCQDFSYASDKWNLSPTSWLPPRPRPLLKARGRCIRSVFGRDR